MRRHHLLATDAAEPIVCSCHAHAYDAQDEGFRAVTRPKRVTDRIVYEHVQATRDVATPQNLRLTI